MNLAVRGLVLIALGQVFENLASPFAFAGATRVETYGLRVPGAPGPVVISLGVLYGLGSALAVTALLIRLPSMALVGLAGVCVLLTAWLIPGPAHVGDPISPLAGLLLVPGIASPARPSIRRFRGWRRRSSAWRSAGGSRRGIAAARSSRSGSPGLVFLVASSCFAPPAASAAFSRQPAAGSAS